MNIEEMYLKRSALDLRELPPEPDLNEMATEMAAGVEPPGAQPMSLKEFATTAADVPAGLLKGSVQGTAGIFGDIVSIGRGIAAAINPAEGESRADAFVRGMELSTGLPTTEDVQQFLDSVLGPVVPAGVTDERRREAAKTAESAGEFVGAGKAVKETAQAGIKAAKKVASTPPRGSIQLAPDLEVEIAPAERSKNFKNWFGDSKVVDEKGNPLVVYHGTGADFDEFKKKFAKQGRIGKGFYFATDPTQASNYAFNSKQKGGSPTVMPVYLKASNILNTPSYDKSKPIDGIKYGGMYLVYEPTQIKSAIGNVGTFDPKDPRITRGAIAAPIGAVATDEENE